MPYCAQYASKHRALYGMALPSGSKASGIDELPYALELEPLNRKDAIAKYKMRSLSGNNPPWKVITRYSLLCSALLLCLSMCMLLLSCLPSALHTYQMRKAYRPCPFPMCRTYLIDYVALLLMVVILVISEEAVPFTRYIYHVDDQVCPPLFSLVHPATYTQDLSFAVRILHCDNV